VLVRKPSAFLLLSAAALVGCARVDVSNSTPAVNDSISVKVSEDGRTCSVQNHVLPCSNLVSHLEQSLKLPKTTQIDLLDTKGGRTDDAILVIATSLRQSGYTRILRIGFIS
jgi:hypothetical protein